MASTKRGGQRINLLAAGAREALHGVTLSEAPARIWAQLRAYLRRHTNFTFPPEQDAEALENVTSAVEHAKRINHKAAIEDIDMQSLMTALIDSARGGSISKGENSHANYVLIESEVGRARRPIRDLPGESFAYGHPPKVSTGGVKDSMQWGGASAVGDSSDEHFLPRVSAVKDYKALNRRLVKEGISSNAEANRFITTHDIRTRIPQKTTARSSGGAPPGVTFGVKNRPQTPIDDVVHGSYQYEWLLEQQRQLQAQQKATNSPVTSPRRATAALDLSGASPRRDRFRPSDTKANILRSLENRKQLDPHLLNPPGPVFKMKRFSDVPPRTMSFRATGATAATEGEHY